MLMLHTHRTNLGATLHAEAWMHVANPDMSMAQAVAELEAAGNSIIEVDDENRRVRVLDTTFHPVESVYVCERCGAYSTNPKIVESHEVVCNGG